VTDNDVRRIEDKVDNVALVLARLEGSLSPTLEKLTEGQDDLERQVVANHTDVGIRLNDHENRLRGLERFRYSVPSMAVLALLIDLAAAAYYLTHL